MKWYLDLLTDIKTNGHLKENRTGVDTMSKLFHSETMDLQKGFPLLTTRKVNWVNPLLEIIWMLNGGDNIKWLKERNVNIWDQWAVKEDVTYKRLYQNYEMLDQYMALNPHENRDDVIKHLMSLGADQNGRQWLKEKGINEECVEVTAEQGYLGPVYGSIWRNFNGVDQIEAALNTLRTNPFSRRILVSAWCPDKLPLDNLSPEENAIAGRQALAPCHYSFSLHVEEMTRQERYDYAIENNIELIFINGTGRVNFNDCSELDSVLDTANVPDKSLSLSFNMRSNDVPVGLPYNLAGYGFLLMMFADQVGMVPKLLNYKGEDVHIYVNQLEGVDKQLARTPKALPKVRIINKAKDIYSYTPDDFEVIGYDPEPFFAYPVAK